MPLRPAAAKTEKTSTAVDSRSAKKSKRYLKKRKRMQKRQAKMDRRIKKIESKLEKRGIKKELSEKSAWDDEKFRLGVILIAGAIGVGLVGAIINFGFLGFLAGLFALAGIVLIVWGLVENY